MLTFVDFLRFLLSLAVLMLSSSAKEVVDGRLLPGLKEAVLVPCLLLDDAVDTLRLSGAIETLRSSFPPCLPLPFLPSAAIGEVCDDGG